MFIFLDFAVMSGLLVISQFLRSRIKFLQDFFIPTPIIAGFIGLLVLNLAPNFGIYPFSAQEKSPQSFQVKWAPFESALEEARKMPSPMSEKSLETWNESLKLSKISIPNDAEFSRVGEKKWQVTTEKATYIFRKVGDTVMIAKKTFEWSNVCELKWSTLETDLNNISAPSSSLPENVRTKLQKPFRSNYISLSNAAEIHRVRANEWYITDGSNTYSLLKEGDTLVVSKEAVSWTMGTYPGILVVLLFATLFMGFEPKKDTSIVKEFRNVANTFFYNMASYPGMYGLALLFGIIILVPLFPELHPGFSLMLPVGFVGGHGTASAVGDFLQKNGWPEALDIGNTFATVGMLTAIFGGMLLINIGTRLGWTRLVKSAKEIPPSIKRGFLNEDEQQPMGRETVSPMAMDPLAWHVALVFIPFGLAYFSRDVIKFVVPGNYPIPLFALSMLLGAGIQAFLNFIHLGQYVNIQVIGRVGSTVSDYLIAFAVASIKLSVVLDMWLPLLIMSVFGLLYSAGVFWFIGRRIFHNFWFARSIFVFGWNTGVVAIGITLLRVIDPKLKSRTLQDYGLAYIFISIIEIGFLIILPPLIIANYLLAPALVLIAIFLACIIASRYLVGWFTTPAHEQRHGEKEVFRELDGSSEQSVEGASSPEQTNMSEAITSPPSP